MTRLSAKNQAITERARSTGKPELDSVSVISYGRQGSLASSSNPFPKTAVGKWDPTSKQRHSDEARQTFESDLKGVSDTSASERRTDMLFDEILSEFQHLRVGARTPNGDDGNGTDSTVPPVKRMKVEPEAAKKLACPFMKHNPRVYGELRTCAGSSWPTVHRVKEHILRAHVRKNRCHRCGEGFGSASELSTHQRLEKPCEVRDVAAQGDISSAQIELLRSKKRPSSTSEQSEEEKWSRVYNILFPTAHHVPSPCEHLQSRFKELTKLNGLDHDIPHILSGAQEHPNSAGQAFDGLTGLEDYIKAQLPKIMRPKLEQSLNKSADEPFDGEQIINLAQETIHQILQAYQRQNQRPQEPVHCSADGEKSALSDANPVRDEASLYGSTSPSFRALIDACAGNGLGNDWVLDMSSDYPSEPGVSDT